MSHEQQQHEDALKRPRSKSGFSFTSRKSDKGRNSKESQHTELPASPKHKPQRSLTSKADPRLAVSELEPSALALTEQQTQHAESLRLMQHRDINGNIISEPDRSNPTRSRWERPLDTIRSFEAAIEGSHRKSYMPPRTASSEVVDNGYSRRSSYIQSDHGQNGPRYGQSGGNYNSRGATRPDSFAGRNTPPNSYYNQNRTRFNQRLNSEPVVHHALSNGNGQNQSVYPSPGYQQSYDTVTSMGSANVSHGTDRGGNSTDPSSENSSVDRISHVTKPVRNDQPTNNYGFTDFGNGAPIQANFPEYNQNGSQYPSAHIMNGGSYYTQNQNNGYGQAPPPPPKRNLPINRVPIKLNAAPQDQSLSQSGRPGPGEKRKSWFKRFSRS